MTNQKTNQMTKQSFLNQAFTEAAVVAQGSQKQGRWTAANRLLSGLLTAVLLLPACTKKQEDGSTPEASSGTASVKASGGGKGEDGTFLFNFGTEPHTLNPITGQDVYNQFIRDYACDKLMSRDPDTNDWVPQFAEKLEVAKDGKSWTYTLREGVKFSDGKPVTAEDVKFSFDAIFDKTYNAAHLQPYYQGIEKAEVISPTQVKFTAKQKLYSNIDNINDLYVLPKHIYGNAAEGVKLNKEITCSGAYVIEKYDKGQSIVMKRNADWYGFKLEPFKNKFRFERMRFKFVQQSTVAMEMLKAGELDYEGFSPEMYVKLAEGPEWGKSVLKIKAENKQPKGYGFIGWNLRKPVFQDKVVRKALMQLMNRREMNEKFRYGFSLLATGPLYQQSEYADPSVKPIEFDPTAASDSLKKAGWADTDKDGVLDKVIGGKKTNLEFTLIYAGKDFEKYLVLYQTDLQKAGVKLNLQLLEWTAFTKKLDEGDFDACNLGWGAGDVDWDPKQIWHSESAVKGGSNFIAYKNPEVDKLIEQARQEFDRTKRVALLRKVYKTIAEDAPYAFLFNDQYVLYGVTDRVDRPKDVFTYQVGRHYWGLKAQ